MTKFGSPKRRFAVLLGAGFAIALTVGLVLTGGETAADERVAKPRVDDALPQSTMSPAERAAWFQPGEPWSGDGDTDSLSEQELSSFSAYPLFWLGPSYDGYNLQWVGHVKYDAPKGVPSSRGSDVVTLVYGDCTPVEGANRCASPITVHVRPVCHIVPEMVAEMAKDGPLRTGEGGAITQDFRDGHTMTWTGDVAIEVHLVYNPDVNGSAPDDLRPLGLAERNGTTADQVPNFEKCGAVDFEKEKILR